jgi:hypothetical protein
MCQGCKFFFLSDEFCAEKFKMPAERNGGGREGWQERSAGHVKKTRANHMTSVGRKYVAKACWYGCGVECSG